MSRQRHYLVAYAHAMRAEKAGSEDEAMRQAFGLVDSQRMTLAVIPGMPRSMSRKALDLVQKALAVRHFRRTGSVVSGWEKEPGIANVHWTSCPLCGIPITTEPKDQGENDACCQACEASLATLGDGEQERLSVVQLRQRLSVKIHHSPCCEKEVV